MSTEFVECRSQNMIRGTLYLLHTSPSAIFVSFRYQLRLLQHDNIRLIGRFVHVVPSQRWFLAFVQMDVVAFAHLAQILYIDKDTPYSLRDYMQENCPNLVGHCSRVKERCFPDWDEICSSLDMNTHLPKPEKQEEKEGKEEAKESKESKEEKEGDKEKADKEEKEVEKDKEVDENKEKEKDGK